MKKHVILLLTIFFVCKLFSQETKSNNLNIGLDIGIVDYSINDGLLNYYKYDATKFSLINIHGYYLGENHIHFLNCNYKYATLTTSKSSELYKFNTIELFDSKLAYEYYYKLKTFKQNVHFFVGSSINCFGTLLNERYQSNLWIKVSQHSYDLLANLSINALVRYQRQKGSFIFKMGYSIINYGSRPDDYYVKYGNQVGKNGWNWYSVNNYQSIPISFIYHYNISNRLSLKFEYLSEYRNYSSERELKFLKQSWLSGISIKL